MFVSISLLGYSSTTCLPEIPNLNFLQYTHLVSFFPILSVQKGHWSSGCQYSKFTPLSQYFRKLHTFPISLLLLFHPPFSYSTRNIPYRGWNWQQGELNSIWTEKDLFSTFIFFLRLLRRVEGFDIRRTPGVLRECLHLFSCIWFFIFLVTFPPNVFCILLPLLLIHPFLWLFHLILHFSMIVGGRLLDRLIILLYIFEKTSS